MIPTIPMMLAVLMAATGGPGGGDDAVARLQAHYDRLEDLRADFVQVYHSGALGSDEPEHGRLVVAKPGRMRWDYESPEPKLAIVDGAWTWLYHPEDAEIHCQRIDGALAGTPVTALLTGGVRLEEAFRIEALPAAGGEQSFRLRPLELSEDYDEVLLTVASEDQVLRRIEVVDPVGNRLEYRFERVRENVGVADEAFTPAVPGGVAWVGECPPERRVAP